MRVLCLQEFKEEVESLRKNKSYRDIDSVLANYFLKQEEKALLSGIRLLNSPEQQPYIKKRLEGKGGYRVYFLILRLKDDLVLAAIHPKTGTSGQESLPLTQIKQRLKNVLEGYEGNHLWQMEQDPESYKVSFKSVITSRKKD